MIWQAKKGFEQQLARDIKGNNKTSSETLGEGVLPERWCG